ncbi:MAG TPA: FAD-binding oxidoreductase [Bryobacteraceae bacterium]|nr:FAD-binding oxidoreductase [Bryobacteraceae bacterium]
MNLNEYDFSNWQVATVVSNDRITPPGDADVRHMVLEVSGERLDYVEGQSVAVIVPGPLEFGNARHLRLYSIASPRNGEAGRLGTFSLCVRRCFYIDDISGERYPGVASNYLCDSEAGDPVEIAGPYGSSFTVPADETSNLLMIGVGTGIAPFRAFIQHIYKERGGWKGDVRLFYGAKTGLELLYMNDVNKDFSLYYTEKSFKAFEAVSARPVAQPQPDMERVFADNQAEIWDMVQDPKTFVYLAGLTDVAKKFEKAMVQAARSEAAWQELRGAMREQGRYSELLYE